MARPVASLSRSPLVRSMVAVGAMLGVWLSASRAEAYPWMIRHDYVACATCHADPSGAGLLTPYGRAQSEVLLRTRYGQIAEDEDPSKLASFAFGAIPLPEGLLAQADVRAMGLQLKPPSPAPTVRRLILMQADAAMGVNLGRARFSGSLGYVHEGALGASVTHGAEDRIVSRTHWGGIALGEDEAILVRAGRMNLPFGLRTIEHTTFVRSLTKTDINAAQSHGIAVSYGADKIRTEVMAVFGNVQLTPSEMREHGGAGYVEYAPIEKLAVGVSSLIVHAAYDMVRKRAAFRQAHGVFGRYTPTKMVVLGFEADFLVSSPIRQELKTGFATLLQADVEPIQGVHAMLTGEVARDPQESGTRTRGWVSAAWFFLPHADIRADVIHEFAPSPITTLLGQVHGFL